LNGKGLYSYKIDYRGILQARGNARIGLIGRGGEIRIGDHLH